MTHTNKGDLRAYLTEIHALVGSALIHLETEDLLILPPGESAASKSASILDTVLEDLHDYIATLPITPTSARQAHTHTVVQ